MKKSNAFWSNVFIFIHFIYFSSALTIYCDFVVIAGYNGYQAGEGYTVLDTDTVMWVEVCMHWGAERDPSSHPTGAEWESRCEIQLRTSFHSFYVAYGSTVNW